MRVSRTYDVIVVGAGAVGCAIARELARDEDVLLVDRTGVGSEASGMAAGLTAPTLFSYERPGVARYANEFLRSFSDTAGFTYNPRPRIELFRPEDEAAVREQADQMASAGFPVSWVPVDRLAERYQTFDISGIAGGIEIADAGFIDDTYVYTRALASDAERRGATVRTGIEVTGPAVDGGELVGVETTSGVLEADSVVFAAGWRTRDLLSDVLSIPTRPFLLQCVTLDPPSALDEAFPLGRLPHEAVYFRPQRNGRLRLGGGEYLVSDPESRVSGVSDPDEIASEVERRGVTTQEAVGGGATDEFRERVRGAVPQFVAGYETTADVTLEDGWSGVDAATMDGEPILDEPADAPSGLLVATGFNGLGITKSPVAAAVAREIVTGEEAPFDRDGFALDRLPDSTDFELQDTFDMGRG